MHYHPGYGNVNGTLTCVMHFLMQVWAQHQQGTAQGVDSMMHTTGIGYCADLCINPFVSGEHHRLYTLCSVLLVLPTRLQL